MRKSLLARPAKRVIPRRFLLLFAIVHPPMLPDTPPSLKPMLLPRYSVKVNLRSSGELAHEFSMYIRAILRVLFHGPHIASVVVPRDVVDAVYLHLLTSGATYEDVAEGDLVRANKLNERIKREEARGEETGKSLLDQE